MKNRSIYFLILLTFLFSAIDTIAQDTKKSDTANQEKFKPNGKLWGLAFGDYFWKAHADSLNRGNTQYAKMGEGTNQFDIRRIYLGYDFNISKSFTTQLVLAHESNLDASGNRTVFVKIANIRWKNFIKGQDLVFGLQSTPIFAMTSEQVWGYRSDEKTIIDMRKLGGSNDLGLSWQGKLIKGNFGYNFMIGNGTGSKLAVNSYKKLYGELYAKFFKQHLILDFTSDYQASTAHSYNLTLHGMVAYQSDLINGGVEIVNQTQKGAATDTTLGKANSEFVNVVPFGLSFFVRGKIIADKLNYFARYDMYNPNTKYDENVKYGTSMTNYKEDFATAGLDWMPVKSVHIMPNVWYDGYHSMLSNVTGKTKYDYDLVARVTVYYTFNK